MVRALKERLPEEHIVYLGDTARVPYGTKSAEVVRHYAHNCAAHLVAAGAKALVIACNTASAVAVDSLAEAFDVPVTGVINPGAAWVAEHSRFGRIGVIGTHGTISSGRYQEKIAKARPNAVISTQACPLFVPLAEEGLGAHAATRLLAEDYLAPLKAAEVDSLVLGCTHYPLLKDVIAQVMGEGVDIIDSATVVAAHVHAMLEDAALLHEGPVSQDQYFTSDKGERFAEIGEHFLGAKLPPVQWVDLAMSQKP